MLSLFYDVHVTIIIDDEERVWASFKAFFDKHSESEFLYSPSVNHALDYINGDLK